MNKKGFTLVELIAVITIIGLLALIAVPAVMGIIRDGKEQKKESDVNVILTAAYDYVQLNKEYMPNQYNLASKAITIDKVQKAGLLKKELTDGSTDFKSTDIIRITYYEYNYIKNNDITAGKFQKFFGSYLFSYEES